MSQFNNHSIDIHSLILIFMPPTSIDQGHIVLPCPSVCLLKNLTVNLTFSFNFHNIQVTMLMFGMQVAFDNIQLVRVISSKSISNIKVTFSQKMAISGALVFHEHILFFLNFESNSSSVWLYHLV